MARIGKYSTPHRRECASEVVCDNDCLNCLVGRLLGDIEQKPDYKKKKSHDKSRF